MSCWYAVWCRPRMEAWARTNLWQRGLEVYLPRYLKRRRHARRTDWVPRPLFPGYLFVRADLGAGDRRRVDTAPGVRHMVSFGAEPPSIGDDIIAEIKGREDDDGFVPLLRPGDLRPGDRVRVCDGAFCEQVGLFECASDQRRVLILLDILGRKVRVRLPADQVSADA